MKILILTQKIRDGGEEVLAIGSQARKTEKPSGNRGGQASLPKGEVYLVR